MCQLINSLQLVVLYERQTVTFFQKESHDQHNAPPPAKARQSSPVQPGECRLGSGGDKLPLSAYLAQHLQGPAEGVQLWDNLQSKLQAAACRERGERYAKQLFAGVTIVS